MNDLQQDDLEKSLDTNDLDESSITATADEADNASFTKREGEESTIDNEIEQTMKAVGAVILSLEHMHDLIAKGHKAQDDVALLKVIRPMCMNVENSLPALHDFTDNLLAIGEADKATEVKLKIERIEDELLPSILKFLEEHS